MKKNWCTCEETMDEFGGCVPKDETYKICMACGKRISVKTLKQYKKRMLQESGWEEEFEDKLKLRPGK